MLRTSRPCAVTTSGASTEAASRPAGTRKCAQTTSGEAAARTLSRNSRKRRLPPPRRSSTASSISCPRSRSASSSWRTNTPRSGSSGPGYICETRRMRNGATLVPVRVTVRLFAGLRERAGWSRKEIDAGRVGDVWAALDLGDEPEGLLYAVNKEYAPVDQELREGDEVALIPPVSGGAFVLTDEP